MTEERVERLEVGSEGCPDGPDRLDRWLAARLNLSRSQIAALIDQGRVTVSDRPVKKSHVPEPGDAVTVRIPPPSPTTLEPEPLPLEVLHRDDDVAVVVKPAGMVVHPAPGHETGTLVHALLHHVGPLSSVGGDTRPGIVHRLDKDTSGLLVVARTDQAHGALSEALARREVRRGYLAAAWGRLDLPELEEGETATVDAPMGRDPRDRKRMAVVEGGRRAVTRLKRLERWISAELLAVRLHTGRTHQIRVHLRHLGHPVVNDPIYGPGWERGFVGAGGRWAEELAARAERLFLHAAWLSFVHPQTGERLSFRSELPEPLASAVTWARETSGPNA